MTPHAETIARGMLTPDEVACQLGVTAETILDWCRTKRLTAYRFSRKIIRIKQTDLAVFIEHSKP